MAGKRKTKPERNSERDEAKRLAWEVFLPKLRALRSLDDAQMLLARPLLPTSPGRSYYSNLDFFVPSFAVPGGSTDAEKSEYIQFIQRLVAGRELASAKARDIEAQLRRAMVQQAP